MTKAEIVTEIAKTNWHRESGRSKCSGETYGGNQRQSRSWRKRLSPWFRLIHC